MDRMTGRAAVTSHCGSGSTVLRAPDRPACPGGADQLSGRPLRADGAAVYPSPQMALRDMGPVDGATDTGRGRRPKAFRRLMPRDQAGSMNHPL